MFAQIRIKTPDHSSMVNITKEVEEIVAKSKVKSGQCVVYVPHTTASVTVNEGSDPAVVQDIIKELDKIVPWQDAYKHMEGNSAAHIKASMIGPSVTLIIDNGRMVLGTWQAVFLCEFDGPRTRTVYIKVL